MSAASRRLHVSQSALSQTVNALERELGVKLLVRSSTGVGPTEAGTALLGEARAVLARQAQALRTMANYTNKASGVIRLGVPLEPPRGMLPRTLSRFTESRPDARVVPHYLSSSAQFAALRDGELDVGLVRERHAGSEFDAMLVNRETLGVLTTLEVSTKLAGQHGIPLDALGGMEWVGFPRQDSPAWYDELTAILRSHGIDIALPRQEHELIPAVKLISVGASGGRAFALAPEDWPHPRPAHIAWSPLVAHPLIRRTWVVWPANSRRRDIGHLIAAFEEADISDR
ncbi:LysR family transcriptional regulator [Mycolicibacterium agri]|uniref:LysR family transcriptional regulator n=2 Tax=Mycolicibacterium agri TaxID=36811 RepID=A0A2A7N527_MYCAG|nr:LysR family transcriptional regulator [Mycolicibacterium agri]